MLDSTAAGKTALSVRWENGMQGSCSPCVASLLRVELRREAEVARSALTTCVSHKGLAKFFCVKVGELAYAKIMTNPQPKRQRRRA